MSNNTPSLLSVIVPVYNVEQYLYQCLESIVNQEYKNLEIIVVNDASKDNSLEIIQEFAKKDPRIIVINCEKNGGYGKAVNLGIEKASGEWIGIVESDDFVSKSMYQKLMDKVPLTTAPIIRSDYYYYYDKSNKTKEKYIKCNIFKNFGINNNLSNDLNIRDNLHLFYIQPSIWSAIYKKEFLLKNNIQIIETKGASYQDVTFFAETLFEAENIYIVNESLYYYRQTNMSSSSNSKEKVFIIFETCNFLEKKLKEKNWKKFTDYDYKQTLYFSFINHYYSNFYRISYKYKKGYLEVWKQQLEHMINNGLDLTLIFPQRKKELEMILYKNPTYTLHYLLWSEILNPLKKYWYKLKETLLK
ncbi:MAG: glycosyltransferase [Alphaproteobacteria bacterium]|jgi:glycosyltransferase involved in cell wall biosynthesis|nr:glycosyltransferase [Alphaproteobacteria bacterium]